MAVTYPPEKSLTVPTYPIWRLTVAQYHDMIEAGILTADDPVELLEGWLVTKSRKTPGHSFSKHMIWERLAEAVPAGWYIDAQNPITTADSEPEPDIFVVRGNPRDYPDRHPFPQEVALVGEIADTTLQRDRTLKLRVYANARIPVYWILNLPERQLEVYTKPTGKDEQASYEQRQVYAEADSVPVVIDGQEVAQLPVRDLLS
jgi:hypothetical protein